MKYFPLIALLLLLACKNTKPMEEQEKSPIERLDPALDAIISADFEMKVIATGYDWSEGPLWLPNQNMLIFSDVPKNTIYKWTEEKGAEVYLTPSGYLGSGYYSKEPGSNGLVLDNQGNLVLCQHGERRMARMQAPLDAPKPDFISVADNYDGKKFNSPNDACYDSKGNLYFTDPPYGLPQYIDDPTKEIPFQGVYKVAPDGKVTLLIDSITRPNGIALSPDEKYLYIANSDPEKAIWYRYELGEDSLLSGGVFYDATPMVGQGKGVPDGMKIDRNGNIIATGPGGIFIINSDGKLLGRIRFEESTSNCALADNDKILYITNDMNIVQIKLRK
ncbi:MAG: SMP-30/gluconolactonase/LRE family protein [Saprospiraceae bacterium]|nr:SMP-30/gluconolactonase/LRE family protein [Saprospiraceae bacterium]